MQLTTLLLASTLKGIAEQIHGQMHSLAKLRKQSKRAAEQWKRLACTADMSDALPPLLSSLLRVVREHRGSRRRKPAARRGRARRLQVGRRRHTRRRQPRRRRAVMMGERGVHESTAVAGRQGLLGSREGGYLVHVGPQQDGRHLSMTVMAPSQSTIQSGICAALSATTEAPRRDARAMASVLLVITGHIY